MKIEKTIQTTITLTKKEVTEIIVKHINETQGINVSNVEFDMDANDTLDLVKVRCYLIEKSVQ